MTVHRISNTHVRVGKPRFDRKPLTSGLPRTRERLVRVSQRCHDRTNSNLAIGVASARGRTAAFPSWHPALSDHCRSRQGCLPTVRVQLRGCSSAQRFRAHSRRYGLCGYRHVLEGACPDKHSVFRLKRAVPVNGIDRLLELARLRIG